MNGCQLMGRSPATLQLVELAKRLAQSTAPALLIGPPGTEFEVVAEYIHRHGPQAALPMVRQRCVSWQDLADPLSWGGSGTLFVEGIEHASLPVQLRLLHELESSQLMRLKSAGGDIQSPRIIASTTANLAQQVASGLFLEDLYWQLSALSITIPSLSDRAEDIALIAEHLLTQIVAIYRPAIPTDLSVEAIEQLKAYTWPGNVRELYSALQRAALLADNDKLSFDFLPSVSGHCDPGAVIDHHHLSAAPLASPPMTDFTELVQAVVQRGIVEASRSRMELYQYVVEKVERELIIAVLNQCENVQTKTAARLGINRNTLHKKMKDFGLDPIN